MRHFNTPTVSLHLLTSEFQIPIPITIPSRPPPNSYTAPPSLTMAATKKRKRAKSQLDGKRGETGKGTTAEFPSKPTTVLDSRPPTKKFRGGHPSKMRLPVSLHQSLPIHHPVLSLYFPILLLLRTHLEQTLSFSPKSGSLKRLEKVDKETDADLAFLLDTTVVGLKELRKSAVLDIEDATQSSGDSRAESSSQSEVFTIPPRQSFTNNLRRRLHANPEKSL